MPKTPGERQQGRRVRIQQAGGRQINAVLGADAFAALQRLCAQKGGASYGAVIAELLLCGVAPATVDAKALKAQARAAKAAEAAAKAQAKAEKATADRVAAEAALVAAGKIVRPTKTAARDEDGVFRPIRD